MKNNAQAKNMNVRTRVLRDDGLASLILICMHTLMDVHVDGGDYENTGRDEKNNISDNI